MGIVYVEPRYSLRNVILSGLGDMLGEVAKEWINRGKMAKLMEGQRLAYNQFVKTMEDQERFPSMDEVPFTPAYGQPPAEQSPLEAAAAKAGIGKTAEGAFPGLNPAPSVGRFRRDVDPFRMIADAYNEGKKQGLLAYMPNWNAKDVFDFAGALETRRAAPILSTFAEKKVQGMDELHEGFKSNPFLAPFAGSAYTDERAGAAGLEGLIGKANNENEAERNKTYAKSVEYTYEVGKENNAVERERVAAMKQENAVRLAELNLRLKENPHDALAREQKEFFERKNRLLDIGPDKWTEADWRFMFNNDNEFSRVIADSTAPNGIRVATMDDYKRRWGIPSGSGNWIPGAGKTYDSIRSRDWVDFMGGR